METQGQWCDQKFCWDVGKIGARNIKTLGCQLKKDDPAYFLIDTLVKRRPSVWQVVASVILLSSVGCGKSGQPQARSPEVAVARVEQRDVPISKEWVGTLDGRVNAQIKSQVTGYLLRRHYAEGSAVRMGQLLFEIDPRTFQAALDQTRAQLANAKRIGTINATSAGAAGVRPGPASPATPALDPGRPARGGEGECGPRERPLPPRQPAGFCCKNGW